MLINADFTAFASSTPADRQWVPSPQGGVERVMLDRVGAEVARATSLVRYAKNSAFARHQHPGGEEILVLEGTFSDESGDYPAGWYLRNPPGSSHRPHSEDGAVIFVKLYQMQPGDLGVRIDTRDPAAWQTFGGRHCCLLSTQGEEQVFLERLAADRLFIPGPGGNELLVLEGSLTVGDRAYPAGSWIRLPPSARPVVRARGDTTTVFAKTGHLAKRATGGEVIR